MSTADTSEKGLETLIVESLVGHAGYVQGSSEDYDRGNARDLEQLRAFVNAPQPVAIESMNGNNDKLIQEVVDGE